MVQGKSSVDFSMDPGQTGIVNGYISGVAKNISTRHYIDGAVTFASETLSAAFEEALDLAARAMPERFYHVYNWGEDYGDRSTVGLPQFRLWKLVTTGKGQNRAVGFTFLPETRPSPIEPELLEPGENERSVNSDVHIFMWKAPVMEYGIEVVIRPKLPGVKAMAFVDDDGEIIFRKGEVRTIPGYRTTTGVFTSTFIAWWSQAAHQVFDTQVKPELERDVITNAELARVAKRATRRRRKDMGISAIDFRTGEQLALKHMKNNEIDYVRRARRRRMSLYGY